MSQHAVLMVSCDQEKKIMFPHKLCREHPDEMPLLVWPGMEV